MSNIDYLRLLELPKSEFELHQIIVNTYPQWAGPKPLTLRKGTRLSSLRITVNCADCGTLIEWEPNRAFTAVRKGNKRAFCGDCSEKFGKKPVMGNKGCKLPHQLVDMVHLGELPAHFAELYRQVEACHPEWIVVGEQRFRRGSKIAVLRFQLICPACQAELVWPYHKVAKSLREGNRKATCGKQCTAILQRRQPRPCKGCGTPITLHSGLHYCGLNCPGRRPTTLRLEQQPEGLEGLYALVAEQAPDWLGRNPLSFRNAGWGQALIFEFSCPTCFKRFERNLKSVAYSYRAHNSNQIYCSRACFDGRRLVENYCKGCGELLPDKVRHKRWYCSDMCKTLKWPKVRACNYCKQDYSATPKSLSYCSATCAHKAHSLWMRGPGYNPDRHYGALFRHMRPLILQRDKRCVVCQTTEKLAVHHIDCNKQNNRAVNLICLCFRHHRKHHSLEDYQGRSPYPWLADWATEKTELMPPEWKNRIHSLRNKYLLSII
jgi:endogenous inhibitor of DNA gyrase (YacG/DUF329 family)